jgi:quercetin dioxygenase-like cupin family protein
LDTELLIDPMSQKIMEAMNSVDISKLGIHGKNSESEKYYFQKDLNRVTIEGNEDYRLVLFFIKKGMEMPLHDHPNMSVYFKLLFGKLNYTSYDKIDDKFKYNQFSNDEYEELLETKK